MLFFQIQATEFLPSKVVLEMPVYLKIIQQRPLVNCFNILHHYLQGSPSLFCARVVKQLQLINVTNTQSVNYASPDSEASIHTVKYLQ